MAQLERDPRNPGQLALDALVHLIEAGHAAKSHALLPPGPALIVAVTLRELNSGTGGATIEGQSEAIGIPAAERVGCASGIRLAVFDASGQAVDLGRTQRLFSATQRSALALRDGGCRYPGCSRPPSWTEAHHIVPWDSGGKTDVRNGILLCRYHHLHLHNTGGAIERRGHDYVLIPSRASDPNRRPIPMPTKSAQMRKLLHQ